MRCSVVLQRIAVGYGADNEFEGADINTGLAGGSELAIVPHGERVALAGIAALEPATEPSLPLLARPVRELPLVGMAESVIADGVRGGERRRRRLHRHGVLDPARRCRAAFPPEGMSATRALPIALGIAMRWWLLTPVTSSTAI
jgi:hypothetical protein